MSKQSLLICDIETSGHHIEYIEYLLDYVLKKKINYKTYFLVSESFKDISPTLYKKLCENEYIVMLFIEKEIVDTIFKNNIIKTSYKYFKLIEEYANNYEVNHVVLLNMNLFQFSLIIHRPKFTISGILFMPFIRMEIKSFKDRLNYLRKYLQTYFYLINSKLSKIFILNDLNGVHNLNKKFRTQKFSDIPDPVKIIKPKNNFNIRNTYGIAKEKALLLHIGSLEFRKGTIDILDSFSFMPSSFTTKIALLIVGKTKDENFKQFLEEKISNLNNIDVKFINEYVDKDEFISFIKQSDFVLAPYKNAESSSGIVGHCIVSNTPVIVPDKGLIGELIKKYDAGYLLKDTYPETIARGIERAVILNEKSTFKSKNKLYLSDQSPVNFVIKLLYDN